MCNGKQRFNTHVTLMAIHKTLPAFKTVLHVAKTLS